MLLSNEELHDTLVALGRASDASISYLIQHPFQRGDNYPYAEGSEEAQVFKALIQDLNTLQDKVKKHGVALYRASIGQ